MIRGAIDSPDLALVNRVRPNLAALTAGCAENYTVGTHATDANRRSGSANCHRDRDSGRCLKAFEALRVRTATARLLLIVVCACSSLIACSSNSSRDSEPALERTVTAQTSLGTTETTGFQWLPLLAKLRKFNATLDLSLNPVVQIDELDAKTGNLTRRVGTFSRTTGRGSEIVRPRWYWFVLRWQAYRYSIVSGRVYRISVTVNGQTRGTVDVLALSTTSFQVIATGQKIPLFLNKTFAIRFRIEGNGCPAHWRH